MMFERAMDPKVYNELRALNLEALKNGLYTLAQNGITSAVDARHETMVTVKQGPFLKDVRFLRTYWKREHEKAWIAARDSNILTCKAILSLWAYPQEDDAAQTAEMIKRFNNTENSRLRISQVKVYMDGILPTRTGKVLKDYARNDPDFGIGKRGLNYITQNRLRDLILGLQTIKNGPGFDFIIHATGDGGVREALNAIRDSPVPAAAGNYQPRHKITHVELVNANDLGRFDELDVIADAQVQFLSLAILLGFD